MCIKYCILYKILYTEVYQKQVFRVRACVCVCVKMLQEYWASTVIFTGLFSQCAVITIYNLHRFKWDLVRLFVKMDKQRACSYIRTIDG